ncbi:A disintegrin and metalloproteinase with thrombospondin motifs 4-like [Gigantopelta aegis]|uniref:A disintegrin and metalloproteinase with thrombospondin motifs 4-like n=1 Tax=Gigantopelta aegis TaxID=1735272 RepID=UPI001B888A33|nr:A disintegrin and metalloproteinase with thrombospondin motifs 4-like [Gigantopelta aegis]
MSCGGGLDTRSRTCNSPAPGYMGAECVGDYVNTVPCNTDPCPGQTAIPYSELCPFRWFSCRTSRQCLHFLKRCDCVKDCPDGSDEDPHYAMCIPEITMCTNSADSQHLSWIGLLSILWFAVDTWCHHCLSSDS